MKNYIIINNTNNVEITGLLVTAEEKDALNIAQTMVPIGTDIKIQEISSTEINARNQSKIAEVKKMDKIEAQKTLNAIDALEASDPNEDYSAEKAIYEKIVNDNKI